MNADFARVIVDGFKTGTRLLETIVECIAVQEFNGPTMLERMAFFAGDQESYGFEFLRSKFAVLRGVLRFRMKLYRAALVDKQVLSRNDALGN